MSIYYRRSNKKDIPSIYELYVSRFGLATQDVITNVENRYLLAFDDNLLIGMTGIKNNSTYKGLEIDWTCIREEYEGKGIATKLISILIGPLKEDIYCSCWKIDKKAEPTLNNTMKSLGFKKVMKNNQILEYQYNDCKECPYKKFENCKCYKDLYMRKRKKKTI